MGPSSQFPTYPLPGGSNTRRIQNIVGSNTSGKCLYPPSYARGTHLEFRASSGDRQPKSGIWPSMDLPLMERKSGISSSEPGPQLIHPSIKPGTTD